MEANLGGRQAEYQPSASSIDRGEAEDVPEERAHGVSVLAVDQRVKPGDHRDLLKFSATFLGAHHLLIRFSERHCSDRRIGINGPARRLK
jgi:hypothetical protein